MPEANEDTRDPGLTIMLNFGRWGGFYITFGGWADIRVCLGFVAITVLREDIDLILEEYCDLREGEEQMSGIAYVAIKACGCMCFAVAEARAKESRMAYEIASCLRAGLRVERVTDQQVRDNPWGCPKCQEQEGADGSTD